MPTPSAVAVVLAFALPSSAAQTAPPAAPRLERLVTIKVSQAPLGQFLDALSAQGKVNFILEEGIENERVTAFLQKVKVGEALDILEETHGIRYRPLAHGANIYVGRNPRAAGPSRLEGVSVPDRKVTLRLQGATLAQFFGALSEQTGAGFALAEGLADRRVSAHLEDVALAEALEVVLEAKDLTLKAVKGTNYVIR
jgi:type II secretory pathway component GspD/PulD (secretin)